MKNLIFPSLAVLFWAGCAAAPEQQPAEDQTAEPEPVVVTLWSEKTELFVEFPPLIAGETSRFAIHFTDLASFQPLIEGRSVVELDYGSAAPAAFSADGPSRPGIFGVDVNPPKPLHKAAYGDRWALRSYGAWRSPAPWWCGAG